MSNHTPQQPLKACRTCGDKFPPGPEHFRARMSAGRQYSSPVCRSCERLDDLKRYYAKTGRKPPPRLPDPLEGMKRCPKCGKVKPANSDTFTTRLGDLDSWCRECSRAANAERHRRNPEPARQRAADWRERNPERYRLTKRAHYEKNRERILAEDAEYYRANVEKRAAYARRWYATPRGNALARAGAARRRARLLEASGTHTQGDIRLRYEMQHGKCYWCGDKVRFGEHHVDHIQPISKGGSNGPENICIACPPCNRRKYDKTPLEFSGRLF